MWWWNTNWPLTGQPDGGDRYLACLLPTFPLRANPSRGIKRNQWIMVGFSSDCTMRGVSMCSKRKMARREGGWRRPSYVLSLNSSALTITTRIAWQHQCEHHKKLKHAEAQCSALWSGHRGFGNTRCLHLGSTDVSSSVVTQKNIKVRLFFYADVCLPARSVQKHSGGISLFSLSLCVSSADVLGSCFKWKPQLSFMFHTLLIWANIGKNYWAVLLQGCIFLSFIFFFLGGGKRQWWWDWGCCTAI